MENAIAVASKAETKRMKQNHVTERKGCLEISVNENLFVVDGMIPAV